MPPVKSNNSQVFTPVVPLKIFFSGTESYESSHDMSTQHEFDDNTGKCSSETKSSQDESSVAVESSTDHTCQSGSVQTERGEEFSTSGEREGSTTNKIKISLPPVSPDWFIAPSASVDNGSLPTLKETSSSHVSEEEEMYSTGVAGYEITVSGEDEDGTASFSVQESDESRSRDPSSSASGTISEREESTNTDSGTGITSNYSVYVGGSASTVSSSIHPMTTSTSTNDGHDSHTLTTCPENGSLSPTSYASGISVKGVHRSRNSRHDLEGEKGQTYVQNMREGPPVISRSASSGSMTITAGDLMTMAETNNALRDANHVNALNDFQDGEVTISPFESIPYVHGGYAAAAPLMLYDLKWMGILRRLMPESYADAISLVTRSNRTSSINACTSAPFLDQTKIMKWAENNPVVAAYGILKSDGGRRKKEKVKVVDMRKKKESSRFTAQRRNRRRHLDESNSDEYTSPSALHHSNTAPLSSSSEETWEVKSKPALEWDVFLDPNLVRCVDIASQRVEELAEKEARGVYVDQEERMSADVEVDRQVGRLLSRMMLCHGSTSQLVAEAVGVAPRYNFARVVKRSVLRTKKRNSSTFRRLLNLSMRRSNSDMTSSSATIASSPSSLDEEKDLGKRGPTIEGATGIFVERWLYLFSKALELGHPAKKRRNGMPSKNICLSPQSVASKASSVSAKDTGHDVIDDEAAVDIHPYPACGIFLCLGMEDRNSLKADHGNSCMAGYAQNIQKILGEPLRLVLDMKSRRVPPRVWARLIDNLRSRGLGVDGVGSFDLDELRSISSCCSTPIDEILFFHSAGDLQRACHSKEVKYGDTVYFNAGSLFWKKPGLIESATSGCNCAYSSFVDDELQDSINPTNQREGNDHADRLFSNRLHFQPYAYPHEKKGRYGCITPCRSTLQDYQKHLNLKIGVYVQEFSVGPDEIDAIANLVNENPSIYNLGLAWGGINGKAISGVSGDGYWNQRFMGRKWDFFAVPTDSMQLLKPEDHHMVQKALQAGAWAQVGTVFDIEGDNDIRKPFHNAVYHPNRMKS